LFGIDELARPDAAGQSMAIDALAVRRPLAHARGGNPTTNPGLSLFAVEQPNCIATKSTEGGIAILAAMQHLNG
jgi:hypothetical protein